MPSHCEASLPSSSSTATATISAQRNMLMINFWERPKTQQLKLPQSQHKCIMSENISSEYDLKRQSLKSWKTSLNCVPKKKKNLYKSIQHNGFKTIFNLRKKYVQLCKNYINVSLFFFSNDSPPTSKNNENIKWEYHSIPNGNYLLVITTQLIY